MDYPHFPIWTKEPMLTIGTLSRANCLTRYPEHGLSIIGMDHFAYFRDIEGARLRRESKDAVGFLGPDHLIRLKIPNPVAEVGNSLRFFEPLFALFQISRQSMASFLGVLQFCNVLNGAK
jgi:hypothetical protein